jgi:hypothetical protein
MQNTGQLIWLELGKHLVSALTFVSVQSHHFELRTGQLKTIQTSRKPLTTSFGCRWCKAWQLAPLIQPEVLETLPASSLYKMVL